MDINLKKIKNMDKECLMCEICGREVADGDYITSPEGDIICKCCGFDELEGSYFALMNVVRHLRNALEAAAPAMVALENALEVLPEEVLEQLKADDDADDTEAKEEELSATEGDAGAKAACE